MRGPGVPGAPIPSTPPATEPDQPHDNKLTPTQVPAAIAASILHHLHVVVTTGSHLLSSEDNDFPLGTDSRAKYV